MNDIQRRKKEANYLIWISKIINEDVKNSNIKSPTVMDVKLSNDGSVLKVFVFFDMSEKKQLESLRKIKGFIRSELSKYDSKSRRVPEIFFELDEVQKKSSRIDELLNKIKNSERK